jgi:hypothetical protein
VNLEMALTTAQAFDQFLVDITATEHQRKTLIPSRKKSVDDDLLAAFPSSSDLPYWQGLLIGSAQKNTVIRPINDIDVLAVFSNENKAWDKYWNDSKAFIYRIRNIYDGYKTQQVGTRGQAVRVFYESGGHVDVAPVFYKGESIYQLPDGSGGWLLTSPTIANDFFAKRNQELNYHLAPMVRLLKSWNINHSKRLRSFHLETMVSSTFSSLGGNYRDALEKFFEWSPNHIGVVDPGGQSGDLSTYLSWNGKQEVVKALGAAQERAVKANAAEKDGDHAESKRLWKIILGDGFPT